MIVNSKQDEIREINKQIKELQNKVADLQAEEDSEILVGKWYMSNDSIFLVKGISKDCIDGTSFRDDGCDGIYVDSYDSWSHIVFKDKYHTKITEQDAKEMFSGYVDKLTDFFNKQFK